MINISFDLYSATMYSFEPGSPDVASNVSVHPMFFDPYPVSHVLRNGT